MLDKRKSKRVKARLKTRYTKVHGPVTISSSCMTKNLSLDGLCSALSKIISVKDTLLIEIKSSDKQRLAALAKVIWLKPDPSNGHNICGLKFLWVSSKPLLDSRIEKEDLKTA
jgi:c-di-GMP-binding flagellar brake protein YcgR